MKVYITQFADLEKKPIELGGALSLEIELDNGDRLHISLSTEDYVDMQLYGVHHRLSIEPRAANAVYIRGVD